MKSPLVRYSNYTAGWLDSSVHDFLLDLPSVSRSIQFALVTCLDSNRNPAGLLNSSTELAAIKSTARKLGKGLLMPTSALLDADASQQILHGFDEVWFFPHDEIHPKPAGPGLVGPHRISQERIDAWGNWMASNACSLALGDGEGLSFVLKAQGLVRYLVGNSIQQPVPSPIP